MKRSFSFGIVLAMLLTAGCGGGSDNTILDPGGSLFATPEATALQLFADPQMNSDQTGGRVNLLRAIAKDSDGNAVSGVNIVFSTNSDPWATISNYSSEDRITDSDGLLSASLSNGVGGAANRTITVTATDLQGGVSATTSVAVIGTRLTIDGAAAVAANDVADYLVVLEDSAGVGIANELVTITSANGNLLDANSLRTDGEGKVNFQLTATQPGADTLTVDALGLSTTTGVNISDDVFTLSHAPTATIDIPLTPFSESITVTWSDGSGPRAGEPINFRATRGTLSSDSAPTDGNGQATVTISSNTAGPAVITAENDEGTSTTLTLEFIATNPTKISAQARPFTVAPGAQSEIIAIVRDAQDNLVKNQVVRFNIERDDTNGSLAVSSSTTDSQGRASTFYTGGGSQGAENGVEISATVQGTTVSANVILSVSRREFDFVIGHGNDIFEPTTATFAEEWNIIVTDSVGNSVDNTPIQVSLRSLEYRKGELIASVADNRWISGPGTPSICPDEDLNRNGILDPGEDLNNSGEMEAGNVATVAAVPPEAAGDDPCSTANASGTDVDVLTNAQGIARVCVIWPQSYGFWAHVQIQALSTVSGSEDSQAQAFVLSELADDRNDVNSSPPNQFSPFGVDLNCAVPAPGLPLNP